MHTIELTSQTTEGAAMEVIFNACRNNEARTTRTVNDYQVTFSALPNGEHRATVRRADGVVIARAAVDRFDA